MKAIVTAALNGVLTDPKQHAVPVTPDEMATAARRARDEGAAIVHIHYRAQGEGKGHLPSWDPKVATAIADAIRAAVPDILINSTSGILGDTIDGPLACLRAVKPEISAANAGTLNYLKTKSGGEWAWPPMVFDNPVWKVAKYLDTIHAIDSIPELECFDTGIVRSVALYNDVGMLKRTPQYNFVMGVASGMPADPDLLPLLRKYAIADSVWQATCIGRAEIWPVHRKAAELGGHLRTGLEDTFYLPNGDRARDNGELIAALVKTAREVGREPATPTEARAILGIA
jgi:3-keto-5-aminohexanoate cleavage enzyme